MLSDQFAKVVDAAKEAVSDGKITFDEACRVIGIGVLAAADVVSKLANPNEHYEEVVTELEAIFDAYIAPYDIQPVPDWLESRFVDPMLRGMIRPMVTKLFEAIAG